MKKNKIKSAKKVVSFLLPMAVFFFLFGSPAIGAEKITLMVGSHFVPAFNEELEKQVAAWAKTKGVEARVDFISYKELPTKLVAEAESKSVAMILSIFVIWIQSCSRTALRTWISWRKALARNTEGGSRLQSSLP